MIKVPTNFENKVYAYLRYNDDDSFLIVLNIAKEPLDCQLLITNYPNLSNRKINLEDIFTGIKKISDNNKIIIKLQPETPYVFKLL